MISLASKITLAAALALAATAYASAETPAAAVALTPPSAPAAVLDGPIHLDAVRISPANDWSNGFAYPGFVTVGFTNTNTVPATNIVFSIRNVDGSTSRFTDAGVYQRGQSVRHRFAGVQSYPTQDFAVESATFADGSTWNSADTIVPISRRQSR